MNDGEGKIIDADEQVAAQFKTWTEQTHEDRIALREGSNSIYNQRFQTPQQTEQAVCSEFPNDRPFLTKPKVPITPLVG